MNRARFARSGPGVSITIDLDASVEGADEFVAAITAAVARFAARGTKEVPEAAPSSRPGGPLTNAEKCRRRRERARRDTATVSIDTENDTVTVSRDTEKSVAAVSPVSGLVSPVGLASASLSGSLPSLSPAFSSFHGEIESETRARGDTKSDTATPTPTPKTTPSGVAANADLDQPIPAWARARIETLRMNLGPPRVPIELALEWARFVAHMAKTSRLVGEAEWQSWLTSSWTRARAQAEQARPVRGRGGLQNDETWTRDPTGGFGDGT